MSLNFLNTLQNDGIHKKFHLINLPRTKKGDLALAFSSGLLSGLLIIFIFFILNISIPLVTLAPIGLPILFIIFFISIWSLFKNIPVVFQLAKFAMIGTSNTLLDISILNILIFSSGIATGLYFALFKTVSFSLGLTNSYFWNRFWTFNNKWGLEKKECLIFTLMTIIGLAINVGIASVIVNIITPRFDLSHELWANVAAVIAALTTMTWNFLSYKFLVFKEKQAESPETNPERIL